MVVFFENPNSYTGENSAEVHLHGSPFVVRKALSNLQQAALGLQNRESLQKEPTSMVNLTSLKAKVSVT